ncbi:MAG: hypothetical protein U5O69_03700 [Candidatus Competibacteraceae bacterium]|nr:hypothetical protein [Candidatus Competibacteraceae bacterium]
MELADDGLPAVYRGSDGTEARLENLTATAVTVRFSRGGQAVADPVTVPINGSFLQTLQAFANQLRSTVQSVETASSGWVGLAREDQRARAAKAESAGFP